MHAMPLMILAGLVGLASVSRTPAAPAIFPLWAGDAPGSEGVKDNEGKTPEGHLKNVHRPTLEVFLPPAGKGTGTAVVICPGGGYGIVAYEHEGRAVAQWLNTLGVAGFVLKYRLPRPEGGPVYAHNVPLSDAQRAIRLVRTRAQEWGVDTDRIGILGFSAGGHLASTAGTHFDHGNPSASDSIGTASCRPDFMVLGYPVISFGEVTHTGSRANLLGPKPAPELIALYSNELHVNAETPPTFLFHALDDKGVNPENSRLFQAALQKAGVPAELKLYEKGGHGFGLGHDPKLDSSKWPSDCERWLRGRGLLSRAGAASAK